MTSGTPFSRSRPFVRLLALAVMAGACSDGTSNLVDPAEGYRPSVPVWVRQPPTVAGAADFADLWMRPDGSEGWVAGGGVILHLQSGNLHADTVTGGPRVEWRSIAFRSDAAIGFAVGTGGWIAQRDSGHRWSSRRVAPETTELTSVWVDASRPEAFAVGRGRVALRWSRGRWDRLPLSHDSAQGNLLDVAATDRELWVRDSALITVYDRSDLTWLRDLTGYRTSRLWTQPSSPRVWFAGVTQPAYRQDRYAVFSVGIDRTDTIKGVWVMPRAVWMGNDPRCGLVAGNDDDTEREVEPPYSVYIPGGRTRPYAWMLPDSVDIQALWVSPDCTAGWAVGRRGYLARLEQQSRRVDSMTQEGGKVELLTGRYALVLDSGVPTPSVDSLHLIHGDAVVRLTLDQHFTVDSSRSSPVGVRINDAGRAAAQAFADKKVRLRFYLAYPGSVPVYAVAYEKDGSFYLGGKSFWQRNRGRILTAASLVLVVLVWGLSFPSGRHAVGSEAGKSLLQQLRFGWIYDLLELVFILSLKMEWMRRRVFRTYREEFETRYAPGGAQSPVELRVGSCAVLGNGDEAIDADHAFNTIIQRRDRLLWLQGRPESPGNEVLAHWAALAWERGKIPVLLKLDDEPIDSQIWRALYDLGAINERHQKLWQMGGFVFLVADPHDTHPEEALRTFLRAERSRNFVVLWRNQLPNVGACRLAFTFTP